MSRSPISFKSNSVPFRAITALDGDRERTLAAARQASALLAVSQGLAKDMAAMGMPVNDQGPRLSVTVSIGVVTGLPGEPLNFEALVNRADHALYQAKGTGRNAVYSADGKHLPFSAIE